MKKTWKKLALAMTFAVCLTLGALGIGLVKNQNAQAETIWSEVAIQSEYALGTQFNVPERRFQINGEWVAAQGIVQLPNGSAMSKQQLTLNEYGSYTVVYTAVVGGKAYRQTESFIVHQSLYTLSSRSSSASYGKYEHAEDTSGVMVRLASGDSITFNSIIDVSDVDKNDVLVEAFATPDVKGTADFKMLYFTFTDVENPDVYLKIRTRQCPDRNNYPVLYTMAGGNGQKMTGQTDNHGGFHTEPSPYGASTRGSFNLSFSQDPSTETAPDKMPISLRYDSSAIEVYIYGDGSNNVRLVTKLNSYDAVETLWKGFPSGKVKLSISAGLYEGVSANFCVSKLLGVDLTGDAVADNEGPTISVEEINSVAEVGAPYMIPQAIAQDDIYGPCEVKSTVWYNYGTSNAVMMECQNGAFTAKYEGDYAIVYSAKDPVGNNAKPFVVKVKAVDEIPAPSIMLENGATTNYTVGDIFLPTSEYTIQKGSGNERVKVILQYDEEAWEVPTEGYRFVKTGNYTVAYVVTDYVGQSNAYSYTVTVGERSIPLFMDTPALPTLLVSGSSYPCPELYANNYRSGVLVREKATAKITDKDGTRAIESGRFTPNVANNGDKVAITYECEGASYSVEIPTILAWKDEGNRPRLQLENYFYSENNDVATAKNENSMTITAQSENGEWLFATAQAAEGFFIEGENVKGKSQFSSLRLSLTDAEDSSISVVADIVNKGTGKALFQIGETRAKFSGTFSDELSFSVRYSNGAFVLGTQSYAIKTESGEQFEGFPSGKIIVGMQFVGADVGAQYKITSVNGHSMSNLTLDRTAPKILIEKDYGGTHQIGAEVLLPAVKGNDVLDPNTSSKLTVKDPNGEFVTSTDGILLKEVDASKEYYIRIEQMGVYNVSVTVQDTFNARPNSATINYSVNAEDTQAPIITFVNIFAKTVKLGEPIVIPDYTLFDDASTPEEITLIKTVRTPTGVMVLLKEDSNSIKAVQKGEYQIILMVRDAQGNVHTETHIVNAE